VDTVVLSVYLIIVYQLDCAEDIGTRDNASDLHSVCAEFESRPDQRLS
jgi:hypothetical protein